MESEIKIPVVAVTQVRARMATLEGRLTEAATEEENWVLDDAEGGIKNSGRLLRVRHRGGRAWLTFKGPPRFEGVIKTREEYETEVRGPNALLRLLGGLGYRVVRRYQKRRETWSVRGVEVALDETPMGSFVELEGPAELLEPLARELGLDPGNAVRGSYLGLWDEYRLTHPDAGEDMVFP